MTTIKLRKTQLKEVSSKYEDKELEEIVLGTMLLFPESAELGVSTLHPDIFSHESTTRIFEAIKTNLELNGKADILLVSMWLKRNKVLDMVGGAAHISSLTHRIAGNGNFEVHVTMLKYLYGLRTLQLKAQTMLQVMETKYDAHNFHELMEEWSSTVNELQGLTATHQKKTSADILDEEKANIDKDLQSNAIPGLSCGFKAADKAGLRLYPGNVMILAARPGMGKTSLAFQIAYNVAEQYPDAVVDFYSLEMPRHMLIQRYMAYKADVDSRKILQRKLTDDEIARLSAVKAPKNLFIDDKSDQLVENIALQIKRRKPKLIVIDYLQLTKTAKKFSIREQEVSYISRLLKIIAKEANVPIIALSQLSRGLENRADRKPKLSDLRESGAIEQDADTVAFLYRKAYYDDTFRDKSVPHPCEIMVEKNRNGNLGSIVINFCPTTTSFSELEELNEQFNKDIFTEF